MLALTINMTINKSLTINLTTGQALACRGRGTVINFDQRDYSSPLVRIHFLSRVIEKSMRLKYEPTNPLDDRHD
jgi:hypothetical protein